jgi:hypothetical protein
MQWQASSCASATSIRQPAVRAPSAGSRQKNQRLVELQRLLDSSSLGSAGQQEGEQPAAAASQQGREEEGGPLLAAGAPAPPLGRVPAPKGLQPLMRRALKVVSDPAAFLDGYLPPGCAAPGGGRKKRGKKVRRGKGPAAAGAAEGAAEGAAARGPSGRPALPRKSPEAAAAKLARAARPQPARGLGALAAGPLTLGEQLAERSRDGRVRQELLALAVHDSIHERVKRTVLGVG